MSSKAPAKIGGAPFAFLDVLKQATSFKVTSVFTSRSSTQIDNYIFKLHSTVTIFILSISIVFVGMKQYFGDPIECLNAGSPQLTQAQMQHFCWMEGAFTIISRYSGNPERLAEVTGVDNAYPGVKSYHPHKGDLKMPHKYYQWVYYILCIQCILFYAPKYLWKRREAGRLQDLIDKIKDRHILQYEGLDRFQVVQDTLDVMLIADEFFSWIFFSEILYLLHLVMEIFFLNAFLGGKFLLLGFQWLHYTLNSDNIAFDPLIRMFPRLTKCSFHKYGTSGSLETYDTLCFMPLNIVNEKVFVILWFWFLALLLATIYHILIYRTVMISIPWYRYKRLSAIAPTADKRFLKKISKRPGRWFIMNTIASNLKPYFFRDLLDRLQEDHYTKNFRLDSKVTMNDFIVDGKVPCTAPTAPPKSKPPPPGFNTQEQPTSSGQDNDDKNKVQDGWGDTNKDEGWTVEEEKKDNLDIVW